MKKTLLIVFLFTLGIAGVTNAGSPPMDWVAQLTTKLESDESVLVYCGNDWSSCVNYYIPATLKQISAEPDWDPSQPVAPLSL